MCRLMAINKEGLKLVESTIGLLKLLDHLERDCGGHGNGFVLVKDGRIKTIKKGVKLTDKEIAYSIRNSDFDYAFYHTRVASVGARTDNNCHPYWQYGKKSFLMMNGTESAFKGIANQMEITDTEAIYKIMEEFDLEPSFLTNLSSRFMGFKNGKVFIVNSSYSGLEFIRDKNAFVVASNFPKWVKAEQMEIGLWTQGQTIRSKYSSDSWVQRGSYTGGNKYKSNKDKTLDEIRKSGVFIDDSYVDSAADDYFDSVDDYEDDYSWNRLKKKYDIK